MTTSSPLTQNAITSLYSSNPHPSPLLVQIINIKKLTPPQPAPNGPDRFRLILSDGEYYCQGMVASQMNHIILQPNAQKHALIYINKYVLNTVQGRK